LFSFIELNDGTCLANVQVIAPAELANYETEVKHLSPGSSITVRGNIVESQGKGQATEVQAESIEVHGGADPETYPLQKKRHTFEKLREWAHLRPRTNTFGAIARVRNCVCRSTHDFFQEDGLCAVRAPIITAGDCAGAGAMFRVTTLDVEQLAAQREKVDWSKDFFGRPSFLTVRGQLEADIFACALGKVYTFGPT